jgi:hypothetical protein
MIPGMVSKIVEGIPVASATTVTLRGGELFRVTGTTQINTINPPLGTGQSQVCYLIPTDGAVILGTSGNIAAGVTLAQNRCCAIVWVRSLAKWYIENGA